MDRFNLIIIVLVGRLLDVTLEKLLVSSVDRSVAVQTDGGRHCNGSNDKWRFRKEDLTLSQVSAGHKVTT